MDIYVNLNSLGDVYTIDDVLCIPARIVEDTITNVDESNAMSIPENSLYNLFDFDTQNGEVFVSKFMGEKSLNQLKDVTSNNTVTHNIIYHFFVTNDAINVDDFNDEYRKDYFNTQVNDDEGSYVELFTKWALKTEDEYVNDHLSGVDVDITWLEQPEDYNVVPVISIRLKYTENTEKILSISDRSNYDITFGFTTTDGSPFNSVDAENTIEIENKKTDVNIYLQYNAPVEATKKVAKKKTNNGVVSDKSKTPKQTSTNSIYPVPSNAHDLYNRTNNLRCHVTYFDGPIVKPLNKHYVRYLDSNCWAYTQAVYKYGDSNWSYNETRMDGKKFHVHSAYFGPAGYSSAYQAGSYTDLYPYVTVNPQYAHNPDNGIVLGGEVPFVYDLPDGKIPVLGFEMDNRNRQSAICFTNLTDFTPENGTPKKIYAYTEGKDYSPTIMYKTDDVARIVLTVKEQNVGRLNLETNTILTRW